MKKKVIYLIGSGGHAKVIIDILLNYKIKINKIISNKKTRDKFFERYDFIYEKDFVYDAYKKKNNFYLGIGSTYNMRDRLKIINRYSKLKINFEKVISKSAIVSESSMVSSGTHILNNSIIGPSSKIGENCIINSGAIIEHDVTIGSNCHIAPGAVVLGGAYIGSNTFIGSNSTIVQATKINDNSFIKAGKIIK